MITYCSEHNILYELDKNHKLLIRGYISDSKFPHIGYIQGYGAEVEWCQIIDSKEWYKLIKQVIKNNPLYEYYTKRYLLYEVSASNDIDNVFSDILAVISFWKKGKILIRT